MTPLRVLTEMMELSLKMAVGKFVLISDAVPPSWFRKLCDIAGRYQFDVRTWSYLLHHTSLTEDFFNSLAAVKASVINFGTESFSDPVLRMMRKQATSEIAVRNIRDAASVGLNTVVNIIPDYPTSTFDDVLKTYSTLHELGKSIDVINPQPFDLTYDTDVANRPEAYGLSTITGAYERSSHGYHSIPYERVQGLSKVERGAAIDMMRRLSSAHRVQRRNGFTPFEQLTDDAIIRFDLSFYVRGDTVHLTSLGNSLRMNEPMRHFIRLLEKEGASDRDVYLSKANCLDKLKSEGGMESAEQALRWMYSNGYAYIGSNKGVMAEYP